MDNLTAPPLLSIAPHDWKAWLEEKAALLEDAASWRDTAQAWHAEAIKQARENVALRTLLKKRMQLIVQAMPEIS
jgi:hypothetical protein